MFVKSKINDLAVNLARVKFINVEEVYPRKYAVKVWLSDGGDHSLAWFDKKEDAVKYMEMICTEYNQAIKENKNNRNEVKNEDKIYKCPKCGSLRVARYVEESDWCTAPACLANGNRDEECRKYYTEDDIHNEHLGLIRPPDFQFLFCLDCDYMWGLEPY